MLTRLLALSIAYHCVAVGFGVEDVLSSGTHQHNTSKIVVSKLLMGLKIQL